MKQIDAPQTAARRARRWPWVVAVATMVVCVLTNLLYPEPILAFTSILLAIVAAFALVGALLIVRVPGNRVGQVLLAAAVLLVATVGVGTLAVVAPSSAVPAELLAIAGIVNEAGFVWPVILVLVGIPLIYPEGHLLSRRWASIVALAAVALLLDAFAKVVGPPVLAASQLPNPFAIQGLVSVAEALESITSWLSIILFAAAVLAVVLRYRRGDEVQRHQLKWLIAVAAVAAVAFPVLFIVPGTLAADIALVISLMSLFALPLAIGVAILRYRLYDIDRIISRSIGWGLVTGLLVAAFAVLVVGLQAILDDVTQGETLAVAASTLIAFALFQPVRRTVQRAVDRRFDRARYDSQQMAGAFGERLRSEVDLEAVASDLTRSVDAALRPSSLSLWLKDGAE